MNINTRNRTELKAYFVKNAIPTQSNFAELIGAGLNQQDDGIAKLPGDPLSIEASGDATSQKKAINFYDSFSDASASWVLALNPRSDPADSATAQAGFSISDGAGSSRLFIDPTGGNVGIGTVIPDAKLDVRGSISVEGGIIQEDWQDPLFENGWINADPSGSPCSYFKDSMGIVHLRGVIKAGTLKQTIFTLPDGYRPEYYQGFLVGSYYREAGKLTVATDGAVSYAYANNTLVYLGGVSFRAA